ncbi:MAG: hypothetical protein OEY10_00090 [Nitrosopumilus sp.]|nr:hypothetical protein [Nitrosopumilus sp.]
MSNMPETGTKVYVIVVGDSGVPYIVIDNVKAIHTRIITNHNYATTYELASTGFYMPFNRVFLSEEEAQNMLKRL